MRTRNQTASPRRMLRLEKLEPRQLLAVTINEFVAANSDGLQDEDGDSSDWVEFYNSGPDSVSLAGWTLTDDADELTKWSFPAVDLAADEYLVVFASGKDRSVAGQQLHTSFALNSNGEDLLLVMPDGTTIADAIAPFPEQLTDVSYGKIAESTLGYMETPTPGEPNATGTLGFVEDTAFSIDRGYYSEPFALEITTPTPDATIRYTLDGSVPTETEGLIYDPLNPPMISTTTVVRAAGFKPEFFPTNVDTQTYIFLNDVLEQDGSSLPNHADWGWRGPDWAMDPDVVNHPTYSSTIIEDMKSAPTVSLVMPWDEWFGTGGDGIYISGQNDERSGSVEFFTTDGVERWQIDSALEIQGGTSTNRWKMDKLSIRATFKQPFGPTKLDAELFHNPTFDQGASDEFDTLIFDAQMNYTIAYGGGASPVDQRSRAKHIQDQFIGDLQNSVGGAAPHGRVVNMYINGVFWGMYVLHERPDESFAAAYLGGDKDDYDVLKHEDDGVVAGDDTAADNYAAMLQTVRQDMGVPANYAAAAELIDVDDLISYMIVNYYGGNTDWPHHNWYASFNRVDPEGKWRFHSWDAEHVLKGLNHNVIFSGGFSGSPEELHDRLMDNDEYRLRFNDLVHRHFFNDGAMTPENAAALYMARVMEADRAMVGESARWGDNHTGGSEPEFYSHAHWMETQNDLFEDYFPNRTGIVFDQFDDEGWIVSIGAPRFSQFGGSVSPGQTLSVRPALGAPVDAVIYYTLDGSDPRDPETNLPGASAILYEGQIDIDEDVRVRARSFYEVGSAGNIERWSAVTDASFVVDVAIPLQIVELHYNPDDYEGVANEQQLEFIELLATGESPINLDGVQITEFANSPYQFPAGLTLDPGERIVVARNPATLRTAYGIDVEVVDVGYAPSNLSNGGERVMLVGPSGEVWQDLTYNDLPPWPTTADGGGYSLEIIDPLANADDASNWQASFYLGGSPGEEGVAPHIAGDFDSDGVANGTDFLTWQRGFGAASLQVDAEAGDSDGDRDVDAADLDAWMANFGQAATLESSLSSSADILAAASSVSPFDPSDQNSPTSAELVDAALAYTASVEATLAATSVGAHGDGYPEIDEPAIEGLASERRPFVAPDRVAFYHDDAPQLQNEDRSEDANAGGRARSPLSEDAFPELAGRLG